MKFLTRQERFTILFLVLLFVIGTSLYLYKLNHPSFAPAYTIEDFDERIRTTQKAGKTINYNLPAPPEQQSRSYKKAPVSKKSVNINSASEAALVTLPGIGPVYAERIIAYREKHGAFSSIEEIMHIKGIGEKTFRKMEPYLTVE